MLGSFYTIISVLIFWTFGLVSGFIGMDAYYSCLFTQASFTGTILIPRFQEFAIEWFEFFDNLNWLSAINFSWLWSLTTIQWFVCIGIYIGAIIITIVLAAPIGICIYTLLVKTFKGDDFNKDMRNAFTQPHFASDRFSDNDLMKETNTKPYRNDSYNSAMQDSTWDVIKRSNPQYNVDNMNQNMGNIIDDEPNDVFETDMNHSKSNIKFV
jgi:hypothetical protein